MTSLFCGVKLFNYKTNFLWERHPLLLLLHQMKAPSSYKRHLLGFSAHPIHKCYSGSRRPSPNSRGPNLRRPSTNWSIWSIPGMLISRRFPFLVSLSNARTFLPLIGLSCNVVFKTGTWNQGSWLRFWALDVHHLTRGFPLVSYFGPMELPWKTKTGNCCSDLLWHQILVKTTPNGIRTDNRHISSNKVGASLVIFPSPINLTFLLHFYCSIIFPLMAKWKTLLLLSRL